MDLEEAVAAVVSAHTCRVAELDRQCKSIARRNMQMPTRCRAPPWGPGKLHHKIACSRPMQSFAHPFVSNESVAEAMVAALEAVVQKEMVAEATAADVVVVQNPSGTPYTPQ